MEWGGLGVHLHRFGGPVGWGPFASFGNSEGMGLGGRGGPSLSFWGPTGDWWGGGSVGPFVSRGGCMRGSKCRQDSGWGAADVVSPPPPCSTPPG